MTQGNIAALVPASSNALLALPAIGNLEAYITAVHRIPMLTPEQETELSHRYRDTGDLDAARDMVLSHLRLVVSIARQYLGYGLPHADLIQEGNIGLMKAVKRFDPDRGVRLVSFALHWIRAEIHEYVLKNWRTVKIATTKAQRKLFFNLRSLKKGAQALTPAEVSDIARDLNVREQDVVEMETRLGGHDISLEPSPSADDEESHAPIAWLTAPDTEPEQILESRDRDWLQSEGIRNALADLDPRSRRIIETRWLKDESDGGKLTLQQLADEFGVSAERIRQIEARALRTMKGSLAAWA